MTTRDKGLDEINEHFLDDVAVRVVEVMKASHGVMKAPTVEQVKGELDMALNVLQSNPEADETYGQISLLRNAGDSSTYHVRLNLGMLTHFSSEAKEE